jgi:hypothetical protein
VSWLAALGPRPYAQALAELRALKLPSHNQTPCPACDGDPGEPDDEGDEIGGPTCDSCDGDGVYRWDAGGCGDEGLCEDCRRDDQPLWSTEPSVCLRCVIENHRVVCRCGLWEAAEAWGHTSALMLMALSIGDRSFRSWTLAHEDPVA